MRIQEAIGWLRHHHGDMVGAGDDPLLKAIEMAVEALKEKGGDDVR